MALRQHIEDAINKCKAEKERAIAAAKEKETRETIVPYNLECDKYRDDAIAKLTAEMNESIAAIQKEFAAKKQEMTEANEKKKSSNTEVVISAIVASVGNQYDKTIQSLQAILDNAKE